MLTVIPVPLTTTEIEGSNKSVIKCHLMNSCFVQFNQLLRNIRSSLTQLSTLLTGYSDTIEDKQLQLLQCLLSNKVPICWDYPLNLPAATIDLTCYIEILQRMASLLAEQLLQQQQQSCCIDITYVPNITGLLQEFKLYYCNTNNVQADEISLSCEVSDYINVYVILMHTNH